MEILVKVENVLKEMNALSRIFLEKDTYHHIINQRCLANIANYGGISLILVENMQ